jgi:hypothetical protein
MFITRCEVAAALILVVVALGAAVGAEPEKPRDSPKAVGGLSARIKVKSTVPLETKKVEAELVLTNDGDKPVRVCTLCGEFPTGKAAYQFRPDWFKSDRPSPAMSEKAVVTLQPGKSVSLPFSLGNVDRTKDDYTLTASYEVEDEFAKAHDTWKGRVEAEPVTVKVKKADGPMSLEFHRDVPPSERKIVLTAAAKATRSDKKLTLSVKIANESADEIMATLAHEWHGGEWPPTCLYASVTPADEKKVQPFVPAYRLGEDPAAAREFAVAADKDISLDVRMDWPGTGSQPGTPLMKSGRKYKVRLLLVFKADGLEQYAASSPTEVEAPSE